MKLIGKLKDHYGHHLGEILERFYSGVIFCKEKARLSPGLSREEEKGMILD